MRKYGVIHERRRSLLCVRHSANETLRRAGPSAMTADTCVTHGNVAAENAVVMRELADNDTDEVAAHWWRYLHRRLAPLVVHGHVTLYRHHIDNVVDSSDNITTPCHAGQDPRAGSSRVPCR